MAARGRNTQAEIIAMEANSELLQQRVEAMASVTAIQDECKILIDGGTFGHMWGTAVQHMLVNRRNIPGPGKRIMTAGGEARVHEMADLYIGEYELLDGYVNDNMVTSLLCEGDLARNHGWQFLSAGDQKLCMTPQGNFVAERHGNLHFWPVEKSGLNQDRTQIAQQPHMENPVLPEHTRQIQQALQEVQPEGQIGSEETETDDEDTFLSTFVGGEPDEDEESVFLATYVQNSTEKAENRVPGGKPFVTRPTFESCNLVPMDSTDTTGTNGNQDSMPGGLAAEDEEAMFMAIYAPEQHCTENAETRVPDGKPFAKRPTFGSDNLVSKGSTDTMGGNGDLKQSHVDPAVEMDQSKAEGGLKSSHGSKVPWAEEPPPEDKGEQQLDKAHTAAEEGDAGGTTGTGPKEELCMPVTTKGHYKALSDHIRSGHVMALPDGVTCESCIKGSMRNKPAFNTSKTSSQEDKLETLSVDLLDMLSSDCNGDRYNVTMVMNKTGLGMSAGLENRRMAWVKKLRQPYQIDFTKVLGTLLAH